MDTIIIHTERSKTKALTEFLQVFGVKYDLIEKNNVDSQIYNEKFVAEILESKEDKLNGKGSKVTIQELESLWK
ncbi:MAG: hypothetical protein R2774_09640 [Saprospiraceae bacterium]